MANSPSERWENGKMVERAIETNRWKVQADGTVVDTATEEEETEAKAVSKTKAQNKSVKQAAEK